MKQQEKFKKVVEYEYKFNWTYVFRWTAINSSLWFIIGLPKTNWYTRFFMILGIFSIYLLLAYGLYIIGRKSYWVKVR